MGDPPNVLSAVGRRFFTGWLYSFFSNPPMFIQAANPDAAALRCMIQQEDPNTANRRLEAACAELEAFVSCVPSILIGLDAVGRITRWNMAASALGMDPERALGRTFEECGIHWVKPDMRTEVSRWLEAAQPSHRSEDIPYLKDQKTRLLGLHFRRILQGGQTTGFVITGADVTEVRALELELRQAQRLEAVGQLAAGIAHEMNTPIQYVSDNLRFLQEAFQTRQTVLGAYERLRSAALAGDPLHELLAQLSMALDGADMDYLSAEVPKAFAQSLDGVERVATIVRAMKEFAHPGRKEKAAADLNRALSNALIVARNEIKYVADVETDLGELPPVVCHLADMNQVFLNLLINAAHAIREVVQKTDKRGKITVRTRVENKRAVIGISDTGCGIPASIQAKVFDPFFTTKPVGQGTGQGLSIARSIVVEKHGGTLTFEPNGTQGTKFLVALPLDAPPSAAPEENPAKEPAHAGSEV